MFNLLQISIKLNNYNSNIFNILKTKYKYPCKYFPPAPIYSWNDSIRFFFSGQQHQQNQQIQKIQGTYILFTNIPMYIVYQKM